MILRYTSSRSNIWLLTLLLLLCPHATVADHLPDPQAREFQETTVQTGDRCLICDAPLTEDDLVLQYKGRRVPLTKGYRDEFISHPEKYFWKLQSKGALFTEHESSADYTLLYVVIGILCVIVNASITTSLAMTRSGSAQFWFTLGLLLPVVSILYVLSQNTSSTTPGIAQGATTYAPAICEHCNAAVHPNAAFCSACNMERNPLQPSESVTVLQILSPGKES